MKVCNTCNEEKELSFFYTQQKEKSNGETFTYYNPKCKECSKKAAVKWYKENPEKFKSYKDAQNHKPKNKLIVKMRSRNFVKSGYYIEWNKRNKDKLKSYKLNREMHRKHEITSDEWESCKEYFNNSCAYCGLHESEHYITYRRELKLTDLHKEHVDHEGSNDITNCVPACKVCNSSKRTIKLEDWYNEDNEVFNITRMNKINEWLNSFK